MNTSNLIDRIQELKMCRKGNIVTIDGIKYFQVPINQEWRLPTISELSAMYNIENGSKIPGFSSSYYWSSTTHNNNSNYAWIVYFGNGNVSSDNKKDSSLVRCVRDIDGGLELAPISSKKLTWKKATEYAETLLVKSSDVTKIKLNKLHYETYKED